MVRRKFRLSDMIPNAWFYKLRDMGAHGRGGVAMRHRASSARWNREVHVDVQQPPSSRWNREVHLHAQQPEADVVEEQPATPTKGSSNSAAPRRASYYYSTREREVPAPLAPKPPRTKDAPSPTKSSRTRHRVGGHGPDPEERGPASAPVPARGKEPVVAAPGGSCRRRDMRIKDNGGDPRRPTAAGRPDVKVIASQNEIIMDLRDEGTPGRRLRPIVTRPATARRQPAPSEQDGSQAADLADVTARASSASEKSNVGKPRRSSASSSSSGRRRLKTRTNSPRLAVAATARKAKPPAPVIVNSYPVVKMSEDPRQDFRESMEEMISAQGIDDAEGLEDLLACYLSLNDAEHHDLIIDVFERIWTSLADAKP